MQIPKVGEEEKLLPVIVFIHGKEYYSFIHKIHEPWKENSDVLSHIFEIPFIVYS
jgi:hypothetical protein